MIDLINDSKDYADNLCEQLQKAGIHSQLQNPQNAFYAGVYFGATRGYERGVNIMLKEASEALPDIFNSIAKSNYDMSVNWPQVYLQSMMDNVFRVEGEPVKTKK